jgi:hypothetical protein
VNAFTQLALDLQHAAEFGAEQAGQAAVQAGVEHNDSALRALVNVESVNARYDGPLAASVTASQPSGLTEAGPVLPDVDGTTDVMVDAGTDAMVKALMGHR